MAAACQGCRRLAATAVRAPAWTHARLVAPAEAAGTQLPHLRPARCLCVASAAPLLDALPPPRRSCPGGRRGCGDIPRPGNWEHAPKAWESEAASGSGAADGTAGVTAYTADDLTLWRANFGFARRQHSLAQFGYTDDELLEWRKPFDELASDVGIDYNAFAHFVNRKYRGVIPDEELAKRVQFFWKKFDQDGNSTIDFGEFIVAGLLFDITWAKEKIRQEGIEEAFRRYSVDGFMAEAHVFELMCDFRFFVSTATDVRKLMRAADGDSDGLVSLSDFKRWVAEEDSFDLLQQEDGRTRSKDAAKRKRGGKRREPPMPPAEPLDE